MKKENELSINLDDIDLIKINKEKDRQNKEQEIKENMFKIHPEDDIKF